MYVIGKFWEEKNIMKINKINIFQGITKKKGKRE